MGELKATIVKLRAELEAFRGQQRDDNVPSFVNPNTHQHKRDKTNKKTRRQRAAEQNAARRREPPTEVQQHALERCPACQYPLRGHSIARRRQVIELPVMPAVPAVRVIEHQVLKRWCPVCQKWHTPKLDLSGEVLGQRRVGHGVAGLVCWLRTTLRLPVAMVRRLLKQIYKLTLSAGEIVELSHAVAEASQTQAKVQEIQRAMASRTATFVRHDQVHMDETTWREDGDNGYVWAMSTTDGLRAYVFAFSRSGQIARGLLRGFSGTLVTDFYGGYNDTPGRHQRCWVHLLRDLHALKDAHTVSTSHPELSAWIDAVIQTYRDGKALVERVEQAERSTVTACTSTGGSADSV